MSTLGRRVLAWTVIAVCALILLKVVAGVVIGVVYAVLTVALVALVVVAILWAMRHT
jgi:hypothetical protein